MVLPPGGEPRRTPLPDPLHGLLEAGWSLLLGVFRRVELVEIRHYSTTNPNTVLLPMPLANKIFCFSDSGENLKRPSTAPVVREFAPASVPLRLRSLRKDANVADRGLTHSIMAECEMRYIKH
ncbi:hypothetical protein THAOC_17612, partial [Thalassiosira oceanica]